MKKKKNSHIVLMGLILGMVLLSSNVYAGECPLGEDVTKDLYGALKIIRILAPLLVIVYSTLDTVKALTKGDGGSELKKVAQRFGKRAVYAVILFFLPMLIDIFMQMADVWDANGNCLQEIENPGVTSGNPMITTKYNKCATIDSERGCNGTGGCYWSNGNCKMVENKGTTSEGTTTTQFIPTIPTTTTTIITTTTKKNAKSCSQYSWSEGCPVKAANGESCQEIGSNASGTWRCTKK